MVIRSRNLLCQHRIAPEKPHCGTMRSRLPSVAQEHFQTARRRRPAHLGALLASVLVLAGCSTTTAHLGGSGNPMEAQAWMPMGTKEYLAIHDMPPPRKEALMAPADQARIRRELTVARDRQARSNKSGE